MSDIFISYARVDRERAQALAQTLERLGWDVWWDPDIPAGKKFPKVIKEALANTRCIIVLWSRASINSDWVSEEAEVGKKREILIPICIDPVDPPMGFGRIQAAELIEWDGSVAAPSFAKLVNDISDILGPPPISIDALIKRAEDRAQRGADDGRQKSGLSGAAKPARPAQQAAPVTEASAAGLDSPIPIRDLLRTIVKIPGGTFQMGSNTGFMRTIFHKHILKEPLPQPVHPVTLAGFEIGAYEVTQEQYKAIMGANPRDFKGVALRSNPVEDVSWEDALKFCLRLSKITGRTFTLPSEAQWEYACRAGSTGTYYFGDDADKLKDYAWYNHNSGRKTHPVGKLKPNAWGLYDMHGNVWEWCLDSLHDNYEGAPTDGSAWEPDTGSHHMIRGGGCNFDTWSCRSATRWNSGPDFVPENLGFRVVTVQQGG